MAKFMAVPHYPYLLMKIPGPNGVISLKGDLKRSFECDTEAVLIAARAEELAEKLEIARLDTHTTREDLELPLKKPHVTPTPETPVKQIVLDDTDPSKTTTIGADLSPK